VFIVSFSNFCCCSTCWGHAFVMLKPIGGHLLVFKLDFSQRQLKQTSLYSIKCWLFLLLHCYCYYNLSVRSLPSRRHVIDDRSVTGYTCFGAIVSGFFFSVKSCNDMPAAGFFRFTVTRFPDSMKSSSNASACHKWQLAAQTVICNKEKSRKAQ